MKTLRDRLRELGSDQDDAGINVGAFSDEQITAIEQTVLELITEAMPEDAVYWTSRYGSTDRDGYTEKAYRKGRDEYYDSLLKALRVR